MPTERECVERERKAWACGRLPCTEIGTPLSDAWAKVEREAAEMYQYPKVTRPRVEPDPEDSRVTWNYIPDGGFGWSWDGSGREPSVYPTPERVRLWASLLANPTEEVEA